MAAISTLDWSGYFGGLEIVDLCDPLMSLLDSYCPG